MIMNKVNSDDRLGLYIDLQYTFTGSQYKDHAYLQISSIYMYFRYPEPQEVWSEEAKNPGKSDLIY